MGRLQPSLALGLAALTMALSGRAPALASEVAPQIAIPILLKVLTLDKNFAAHAPGDFTVVVVYEPNQKEEAKEMIGMASQLAFKTIQGKALKFVTKSSHELGKIAEETQPGALMAMPGAAAQTVRELSALAKSHHWYTLSLSPDPVERGELMIGVASNAGKPQIVIALEPSAQCGAAFENTILKLAKVVQ